MIFLKNCSCLPIKINIENNPSITGPLGWGRDAMKDVHLASATSRCPLPHHSLWRLHTKNKCSQKPAPSRITHVTLTLSLTFNDVSMIIKLQILTTTEKKKVRIEGRVREWKDHISPWEKKPFRDNWKYTGRAPDPSTAGREELRKYGVPTPSQHGRL